MDRDDQVRGRSTLPTSEIVLTPEFLKGLKTVAPKRRRSKMWILFFLVIAGAGGFFAWKRYWPRMRHVQQAPETFDTPLPTASVETPAPSVTASAEPIVSATASVSVTASVSASTSAAPTVHMVKVRRRGPATR